MIRVIEEYQLQEKKQKLKEPMKEINIPQPETTTCSDISTATDVQLPKAKKARPPHCKKCGHPVKGHHVTKTGRLCATCPGKECSPIIKNGECHCEWHQQLNSTAKTNATNNFIAEKNVFLSATEFILPAELSQHSLSQNGFSSNACTVISILAGVRFLQGDLNIPSSESEEDLWVLFNQYREIMIEGNTLYSIINPPFHAPNLTVQDVLTVVDFPLNEMPFVAVNNCHSFASELQNACACNMTESRQMHVLIIPPDKSMVIIQNSTRVCLLDSHCHQGKGGAILLGEINNLELFCQMVEAN